MKAIKYTVRIEVEVLSFAVVPGIVGQAVEQIKNEMINGELVADDGDTVRWNTESEGVDF
jgi:hypothetical protein